MLSVALGSLGLRVPTPTMRLGQAPQHVSSNMPGCGGASPFAPFQGSGSVGDQSQYAPGGQWTQYADGVVVPAGAVRKANAQSSPALAQGQDMQGCGGASPFADFNGGGSAPGVDEKWAPGGQWTTRTAQNDFVPPAQRMQASAAEAAPQNPTRDAAENAEEGAAQSGHASPAYLSQDMQGCGGAAPFATFRGSGSVGDQSQYAPGGQWTYRN
jgi:uncharacterized protein affecting Mg2+/Co2+ transport